MDKTVDERHDHRCMQAVTGHITEEQRLASVGHGDEVEIVAAQACRHPVLDADTAPGAGWRTLWQEELLYLLGQRIFQAVNFNISVPVEAGNVHHIRYSHIIF